MNNQSIDLNEIAQMYFDLAFLLRMAQKEIHKLTAENQDLKNTIKKLEKPGKN